MLQLYKSLVRPHLKCAVQFWSPHLRRGMDEIERVQKKSQMIPEIRNQQPTTLVAGSKTWNGLWSFKDKDNGSKTGNSLASNKWEFGGNFWCVQIFEQIQQC